MKTKIILATACLLIPQIVNAAECEQVTCPSNSVPVLGSNNNCSSGRHGGGCYYVTGRSQTVQAYGCDTCESGYILETVRSGGDCTISFLSECTSTTPECYTLKNGSYQCAAGCYGAASGYPDLTGCTKCPEHATCSGGQGSSFICDDGYYSTGSSCSPCFGVTGTDPNITSKAGDNYYGITACYIPAGNTFSNTNGSGTYTGDCHYSLD